MRKQIRVETASLSMLATGDAQLVVECKEERGGLLLTIPAEVWEKLGAAARWFEDNAVSIEVAPSQQERDAMLMSERIFRLERRIADLERAPERPKTNGRGGHEKNGHKR